jgi:hypothetical protein
MPAFDRFIAVNLGCVAPTVTPAEVIGAVCDD